MGRVFFNTRSNITKLDATAAANDSQIALDTNLDDNQAKQGSFVDIIYIETNRFFVSGHIASADADGTGAAIFSNI